MVEILGHGDSEVALRAEYRSKDIVEILDSNNSESEGDSSNRVDVVEIFNSED